MRPCQAGGATICYMSGLGQVLGAMAGRRAGVQVGESGPVLDDCRAAGPGRRPSLFRRGGLRGRSEAVVDVWPSQAEILDEGDRGDGY
jgi:hypothetical protein